MFSKIVYLKILMYVEDEEYEICGKISGHYSDDRYMYLMYYFAFNFF